MHITKRKTPFHSDLHLNSRDLKLAKTTTTAVKTAPIWTRSICQMQATFPGVEFLRFYSSSKRGRKLRRRMSTSPIKRQIRRFHVAVVQWTSTAGTKKRDARAELLFWSLNLLFFEVVVVVVVVVVA